MSLDQAPERTLRELKGRLETIYSAWVIETNLERRKQLNERFKSIAEEMNRKFGAEGKKAVDYIVAKQMHLSHAQT
jgi:hypothetical protein